LDRCSRTDFVPTYVSDFLIILSKEPVFTDSLTSTYRSSTLF
jgi:hypothetical protein